MPPPTCRTPYLGELAIFPISLGFFYWRRHLETKIWALGMMWPLGSHCFWALSGDRARKCIRVYHVCSRHLFQISPGRNLLWGVYVHSGYSLPPHQLSESRAHAQGSCIASLVLGPWEEPGACSPVAQMMRITGFVIYLLCFFLVVRATSVELKHDI